jgi:hypothetical protein
VGFIAVTDVVKITSDLMKTIFQISFYASWPKHDFQRNIIGIAKALRKPNREKQVNC